MDMNNVSHKCINHKNINMNFSYTKTSKLSFLMHIYIPIHTYIYVGHIERVNIIIQAMYGYTLTHIQSPKFIKHKISFLKKNIKKRERERVHAPSNITC